jgi:hypothetical protein
MLGEEAFERLDIEKLYLAGAFALELRQEACT